MGLEELSDYQLEVMGKTDKELYLAIKRYLDKVNPVLDGFDEEIEPSLYAEEFSVGARELILFLCDTGRGGGERLGAYIETDLYPDPDGDEDWDGSFEGSARIASFDPDSGSWDTLYGYGDMTFTYRDGNWTLLREGKELDEPDENLNNFWTAAQEIIEPAMYEVGLLDVPEWIKDLGPGWAFWAHDVSDGTVIFLGIEDRKVLVIPDRRQLSEDAVEELHAGRYSRQQAEADGVEVRVANPAFIEDMPVED